VSQHERYHYHEIDFKVEHLCEPKVLLKDNKCTLYNGEGDFIWKNQKYEKNPC
jgi:hypothetical protein